MGRSLGDATSAPTDGPSGGSYDKRLDRHPVEPSAANGCGVDCDGHVVHRNGDCGEHGVFWWCSGGESGCAFEDAYDR